jgi:serine/threonine protein kinase
MSELVIEDKLLYLLANSEFYEPMTRYSPLRGDFFDPIAKIVPRGWTVEHRNLWWDCSFEGADVPTQGWKIHVSATPANAPAVLATVARVLFQAQVPFKFVVDRMILVMVNGKRWHRGASGKFITVYPRNQAQCGELLEQLHQATIGYFGPYILSDRRYKDSRVIHYRYGGLLPTKRTDVSGKAVYVIQDEQGGYLDDERNAYFTLPPGVQDPFETPIVDEGEPGTLKAGRYEIRKLLASSNSGNVYLALDRQTAVDVVIKEARPFTNVSFRGLDAVQLLKKEHRLLGLLSDSNIAPRPLDFFYDWEHAYLVEEFLDARLTLREYMGKINLLLRTRAGAAESQEFYKNYKSLFIKLAEIVRVLHAHDIIFSDLSLANVMVREREDGDIDLHLIDFEGAYEEGVDLPTHIYTPGFAPEDVIERGRSTREDDYYALGSLLMAGLFPMNAMLVLNRNAHETYLRAHARDFGLPIIIADLIRDLLSSEPANRPRPERIIEVLSYEHEPAAPAIGAAELDEVDLSKIVDRILGYIESVASFERKDRLYPADPTVFETNPLSIGYGACGVAQVMHRVRGRLDESVIGWIRARDIHAAKFSPGLYTGLSGIAWSLLDMGYAEDAHRVIALTDQHHLLRRSPNLFHGAAGWGMARLRFFMETGNPVHLNEAMSAAAYIEEVALEDGEGGIFWETPDGISASLGHGGAGVSLFLLYLSLLSRDESFVDLGRRSLDWVIRQGFRNQDGGMTWNARDRTPSHTPYWRWGSSGIGRVLLRYWHVTGEARYADVLDAIHIDCDRKYTIFPGYFFGTAGIAEMYLDMARFGRWEEIAERSTRKLLSGCLLFPVERAGGLAFPGESLSRIACDFGTGGAGIASVMHRYATRCGASLMLDDAIPGWSKLDRSGEH